MRLQSDVRDDLEVQIVDPRPRRKVSIFLEALIERLLAIALLVSLAPFLGVLCLAIYLYDRKSPFFWQTRIGAGGSTFRMVKLRTMRVDANPYMVKPSDRHPIVTPIGRLVRRRAVDELPQLWNVVKGDMALIGPRPEMPFVVDDYDEVQKMRLRERPGLSGLWQLSRVRDRMIHHHMEYDLFYIYNRSPGLDAWLFWRTLFFAFTGRATKIRLAARRWERDTAWRRVVPKRSKGITRRVKPVLSRAWLIAAAIAFFVSVIPGVVLAAVSRADLVAGKDSLLQAKEAITHADPEQARIALGSADRSFARAASRLGSPLAIPAFVVPGLRGNLRVAQSLATSGRDIVAAGRSALDIFEALPKEEGRIAVPIEHGEVDTAPFAAVSQESKKLERHLVAAEKKVLDANGLLLLPPIGDARREAVATLAALREESERGVAAANLVPTLFGHGQRRTWLIAAENLAELRGRGGYLGTLGSLTAEDGTLTLGEFQATAELPKLPLELEGAPPEYRDHYRTLGGLDAWQNLMMSPNFPSGGKLLLQRLEQFAGIKADGIIALDPVGLSYLLEATGPIQVEGIPEALTSQNLTDWVLNRIYFTYENVSDERREVLSDIASAVGGKLLAGDAIDARKTADALGRAARERHLVVYSSRPEEQQVISRLGISGEVKRDDGDYLLVVGQNMGENKMDYYIRRNATYTGSIRSDGTLEAKLQISVRNTAQPGTDFVRNVGGSRTLLDLPAGTARSYLSVLVPSQSQLKQVLFDEEATTNFQNRLELGRRLFATYVDVAPSASHTITYIYEVPDVLTSDGYRLLIQNQATPWPDEFSVDVDVPASAVIGLREGFGRGGSLDWSGPLVAEKELRAEVDVPWYARLLAKISSTLRRPAVKLSD